MKWLPPAGWRGEISTFEPHAGGAYRMVLAYEDAGISDQGKTTDNTDVAEGRFLELIENERIVQSVIFQADDPAFAGEMTTTRTLTPVHGGTEVTIMAENVPSGVSKEDHDAGLNSTLANLAAFVE